MSMLATLTMASGILSLLALLLLHFVSPEYKPSWRMVSEYALGKHKWLLTSFFMLWGLSSLMLSVLLWGEVTSIWAKVGVVLLFISGIGAIMGGLFDVKHKHHGLAFLLGVPSLPIAALLIGYHIIQLESWKSDASTILMASHGAWISFVLMGMAMGVMMSGFKKAGIPMGPDIPPPEMLPDGVIAWAGYTNRLLVFCYIFWSLVVANVLR
jgi:hypothetical membrane protein